MASNKVSIIVFSVVTIGLSNRDDQVLKSALWLSRNGEIQYELRQFSENSGADIVILDENDADADALATWKAIRRRRPTTPVILVSGQRCTDARQHAISRPFTASKILKTLDQVAKANGHPPLAEPSGPPAASRSQTRPCSPVALVLDDSLVVREQMKLKLEAMGIEAHLCESVGKVRDYLARYTYDMIFLDVILPDGDGLKICKSVKKDEKHASTPVILLTGKASAFDRLKGRMAGCDIYLTKPLDGDTLEKAIKRCLSGEQGPGQDTVAS
jgi:twitching motility two-component system response regulator PilG